jgi:hypothetical protein
MGMGSPQSHQSQSTSEEQCSSKSIHETPSLADSLSNCTVVNIPGQTVARQCFRAFSPEARKVNKLEAAGAYRCA